MIGNDIIDLKLATKIPKATNKRFLNKIFSETEEKEILQSSNPELQLWQFWSMKEACYKLHQRKFNLSRKVNPKSFVCESITGSDFNQVIIDDHIYHSFTKTANESIHTIALDHKDKGYYTMVMKNETNPKRLFLKEFAQCFGYKTSTLKLKKDSLGIPHVYNENTLLNIPVSLSHHGKYTAFVNALIMS
ncbi:4'-phosphopantetheinyl transferase family protein [Christiangramia salexigens]|uniref:4'-phosphopantetheinyl transferase domain-containing protein n=1 Tax=Christiangramia salexigens TaxID=1913577 RepID=A0A1L3J362_9FLAO|nr:4'-phosphopantetheinyl transferase superfamily protein [Christiangramia salexigens]APG59556.1 hypothetical protein LPB144_03645 [Christiangramia salexigens]